VKALEGLRVLDLTRYIPGPYCTQLLGDLGADVVKVEEPFLGDPTRAVPPPLGEDSAAHAILNRNKRSIAIDLRSDPGVAIVRRLAAASDVLIEAYRPGVLERKGLGAAALIALQPRLVYCSLSGFGQAGPLRARAGHDVTYLAASGFLGTNRGPDGRPVLPLAQVADMAGAFVATAAILAALQARERTGRGQAVDASMFDAAQALMTLPAARRAAGGGLANELSGAYACYNVYRCRDGRYVAVGALEPKFWEGLCAALELPSLARAQWDEGRQPELIETLARVFATRDRDDWAARLFAHDCCVEAVLDLDEAAASPHARARAAIAPLRLADTPPSGRRPAPALGQHTDEVLAAAGYSEAEIEALHASGVVA
jgi:crotonobetainyl-CoA:carnitine CoA-transferase CaiB-like acyl-CoA transferase